MDFIFVIFFVLFGCLFLSGYARDKDNWNEGVCKSNGLKWQLFDTSSQGCRGYKAGDQHVWITFNVDK